MYRLGDRIDKRALCQDGFGQSRSCYLDLDEFWRVLVKFCAVNVHRPNRWRGIVAILDLPVNTKMTKPANQRHLNFDFKKLFHFLFFLEACESGVYLEFGEIDGSANESAFSIISLHVDGKSKSLRNAVDTPNLFVRLEQNTYLSKQSL